MAQARGLLVLLLGYLLARFALPAFYPLLVAVGLALSVEPLVALLAARGLPRPLAAVAALLALGSLLSLLLLLLARTAATEGLRLATWLPAASELAWRRIEALWPRWLGAPPALPTHLVGQLTSSVGHAAARLPDLALASIVAAMGAYLLARDLPQLRERLGAELPALVGGPSFTSLNVAMRATARYLKAQLLLASVTTAVTGLGLLAVGAPYALLAAVGVGVLDIAPALGPATILAPWALGALLLGRVGFALRLGLVLATASMVRPAIEPRLVGGQMGLHPLVTLVSMYVGLQLLGAVGIAIGPVLTATAWAAYLGEAGG